LSEIEPNFISFPHSAANNNNNRVQNRPKKEFETEAIQAKSRMNDTIPNDNNNERPHLP